MPALIAVADGNLTTAATWATVDATALLDAENANTVLTTAYVESQAFSPGAITIDGIAVKVASRAATPSGTISVRLAQGGALVAGTEVTIDVADIPSTQAGWIFFKFAAPVLLLAATPYTVSAKTSVITQVNLYRNATAGNWSRMLRTTTTAAPAAGDDMFILGEWTAAATKDDRAVTMDSTAATDYGSAGTLPGFGIGVGGSLTWAATAATNFILRLSTILRVYTGGTMSMGTTGTPCPRDSSMLLEFDCASDGQFGLEVYGTLVTQGLSRTDGLNVIRCLLNTDETAGATVLGVDTETGWLLGDDIAIASTNRVVAQAETRALTANATATELTVAAIAFNHSGTSPTQGEVVLITRNVRIQSVSTTSMAYAYFGPAASVDCDWTLFRYFGATTTGRRGLEIDTSTGSVSLSYCALANFDRHGLYCPTTSNWNNLTIDNLTGYRIGHQSTGDAGIYLPDTTGTTWSVTNVDIIGGNAFQGRGIEVQNGYGTLRNIRCNSGGGYGVYVNLPVDGVIEGSWGDWDCHSNGTDGASFARASGYVDNLNIWRNVGSTGGLTFGTCFGRMIVDGGLVFGNATANLRFDNFADRKAATVRNMTIAGDSTYSTPAGFLFSGNGNPTYLEIENCTFGVVSGIFTAHTVADIDCEAQDRYAEVILNNVLLDSATQFVDDTRLLGRSFIAFQKEQQVDGTHRTYYPALGIVSLDVTLSRSAAPSEKLAPSAATAGQRLESTPRHVAVNSGNAVNISTYAQKNASFNGVARLMLRSNASLAVQEDTLIATFSAASGVWQQLSGTTPVAPADGVFEFYVDVTGDAGQLNVDDWEAA